MHRTRGIAIKKSATKLGRDLGLNGQEMNALLHDQGFLKGLPGEYSTTEKSEAFAHSTHEHRGSDGPGMSYRADWHEDRYDELILEQLDHSDSALDRARAKLPLLKQEKAERDAARREAYAAERENEAAEVRRQEDALDTVKGALGVSLLIALIGMWGYDEVKKWRLRKRRRMAIELLEKRKAAREASEASTPHTDGVWAAKDQPDTP